MARPSLAPQLCPVSAQIPLHSPHFVTEFEAPEIARQVEPGQFVMVREPATLDPLLGRPFSVFSVSPDRARFSLLYHVVGRGTAALARSRPGDRFSILGPLGHGFALATPPASALLVAGGIGIAGLHLLAVHLRTAGVPTRLLFGARSAGDLVTIDRFAGIDVAVETCTDDGSSGRKGLVTELLEARLAPNDDAQPTVYGCGPSPMLRRLRELVLPAGVHCELALEAHMACGFGVCLGCVVPSATDPGTYRLVCTDGPCMDATEVLP